MNKVGLLLLLLLLYPHRLVLLLLLLVLLLHKVTSKDKSPEVPDDDRERADFYIIGRAYAAVLKLVTDVAISDHKTVALEVLTTATHYSLCLCLS